MKRDSDILCGGVTDRTDKNAPDKILSKDLTGFYASFFLSTRCTRDQRHNFCFSIKQTDGALTVCDEISGCRSEADDKLLSELQKIIELNELAKRNGVYKVTAGLPPEYQPCTFSAEYASGEKLSFTTNNDPFAKWAEDLYTLFCGWFNDRGIDSLMPPRETSQVKRLRLKYVDHGIFTEYGGVNVDNSCAVNGQTYLLEKNIYDDNARKILLEKLVPFPGDYFPGVTKILFSHSTDVKYDQSIYDRHAGNYGNHDRGYFGFGSAPLDEEDSEDLIVSLHAEYESGKRLNIDTAKESEISAMKPLLNDLLAFYDTIFNPNK